MKLYRIFSIIAGLAILAGGVAVFFRILQKREAELDNTSVSVGKPREANEGKPEQTQTIRYDSPQAINYFPYHVITVSPAQREVGDKTYSIVPEYNRAPESDMDKGERESGSYGGGRAYREYLNMVFLDKDYRPVHTLLGKKALILDVWFPSDVIPVEKDAKTDSLPKADSLGKKARRLHPANFPYIFYAIVFEDTNDDKRLDRKDLCDLYVSDIDGRNLRRVGKGIDIWSFSLWKQEKRLFITYLERKDKFERKRFAFYDIAKDEFSPIESIKNSLEKVEEILLK